MVDDIYHVSEMVVLTNITDLIPEVKEQVEVLSDGVEGRRAVRSLRGHAGLKPIIAEIEGLESEGNRIYSQSCSQALPERWG